MRKSPATAAAGTRRSGWNRCGRWGLALAMSMILTGCAHLNPWSEPDYAEPAAAAPAAGPAPIVEVTEAAPPAGPAAEPMPELGTPSGDDPVLTEFDVASANVPNPLRFRVDDTVKMLIWNHPELNHVAPVQTNGNVTLPLVGEVPAEDRTPREIREYVEARLRDMAMTETVYIQPGDSLRMLVWRQPDLLHVGIVQPDGRVSLPLVGQIPAAGRTLEDIRDDVERKLAENLEYPQVSIMPEELHTRGVVNPNVSILPDVLVERRVAVLGEVLLPGLQPVRGRMRVLDALAAAGYKETAELNNVIVIRDRDGEHPTYQFLRLKDYLGGAAADQNIFLQDDDVVMVPKTRIAKVNQFIQNFFTNTRPVLDWWISLNTSWSTFQNARYAEDIAKTTTQVNQIILEQLGVSSFGF